MSPSRTTFTARSPVDLIAVVPYLLGFHPVDSVVLMTFGPGQTFHARVDLPVGEDDQEAVADMLAGVVRQHGLGRVAVLLYTDEAWVAATFHDAAIRRFAADGVEVVDVLRVGRDRFHRACDPDDPGTAYDLRTHPFTAEQVVEGTVVHRSREALAASLDPVDQTDARAVARAAHRFAEQLRGRLAFARPERLEHDLLDDVVWMRRTLRAPTQQGMTLSVDDAGRVLALVATETFRDLAWTQMTRDDASGHVDLWRDLVRRCPPDLVAAPATLLAFAAWLHGNGALAWCALDRCRDADPAYPMSTFVAGLLERAVPPTLWDHVDDLEEPASPPTDREAS